MNVYIFCSPNFVFHRLPGRFSDQKVVFRIRNGILQHIWLYLHIQSDFGLHFWSAVAYNENTQMNIVFCSPNSVFHRLSSLFTDQKVIFRIVGLVADRQDLFDRLRSAGKHAAHFRRRSRPGVGDDRVQKVLRNYQLQENDVSGSRAPFIPLHLKMSKILHGLSTQIPSPLVNSCNPHSVLEAPDHRPAREFSPSSNERVQWVQPMLA